MSISVRNNIKCLGQILLRVLGMCLVICAIILALGLTTNGKADGMRSELKFLSWYIGVYILLVFNISFFISYLPVVLSFNTTRNAVYKAKLILNMVIIISMAVLSIWVLTLNHKKIHTVNILLAITAYLLVAAMSNAIGILMTKFGKKGYLVFVCLCGICGGIGASFSSFIYNIVNNNIVVTIAAIVCFILFVLSSYFEFKVINKYEVK